MTSGNAAPARALADTFVDLYPEEATEILESARVEEVVRFLEGQEPSRAAALLDLLVSHLAAECLARLPEPVLAETLPMLEPTRAAGLLAQLDQHEREHVLSAAPALAAELRELMSYPPDSAGRLMDTRFMSFRPDVSVEQALARLRTWRRGTPGDLPIVDAAGALVGLVSLPQLLAAEPHEELGRLVRRRPPAVHAMAPRDEVVELLATGHLRLLPVVDVNGRLLGVIRQEGLVQAVQEEATADLSTMVGAGKEERALSPPLFAVRMRLPWLNINLLTAFLAASVVGLFESTIAQFTALAVLLPVVAGQSGNTGAQALAVVMRGLALREIRIRDWGRVVLKEASAGLLNGVSIAAVTALGVYLWSGSWGLCLVISSAMVLSMLIAGVAGAAIPLLLTSLRQDPAQSASIILTTVTDVMGFMSFLGLATLFSRLL